MLSNSPTPSWIARVLVGAAATDVLGGAFLALAPMTTFSWAERGLPVYPELLRALGLVVALYGLGHALAARNPRGLWPMVLLGLIGKILLPLGFVWAASSGDLPWELGWLALALGPVWWLPFAAILRGVARTHRADHTPPVMPLDLALSLYQDRAGVDLLSASKEEPQFLVFLRHFGCTFCREALADLATINDRLRAAKTRLVLVHMSSDTEAREMFRKYGLDDVTAVSDPDRVLYRAFALRRGRPAQLLGWSVWKRGWDAAIKQGHGFGWLRGDGMQMPGAFVVSRGHIVAQFIHQTAADRPDYVVLAEQGADQVAFEHDLDQNGVSLGFQDRLRQALSSESQGRG